MNKYLALDCEMGGLGLDTSLLSVGLVVADEGFNVVETREYLVKPDDGIYRVTGTGLGVNKINIAEHDLKAKPYKEAKSELYEFLKQSTDNGKIKLEPIGKQMVGDIAHIQDKLISRASWEGFVSYRHTDISAIANLYSALRVLPKESYSLRELADHYGISTIGLHNSLCDAMISLRVYEAMVGDIKCVIEKRSGKANSI